MSNFLLGDRCYAYSSQYLQRATYAAHTDIAGSRVFLFLTNSNIKDFITNLSALVSRVATVKILKDKGAKRESPERLHRWLKI